MVTLYHPKDEKMQDYLACAMRAGRILGGASKAYPRPEEAELKNPPPSFEDAAALEAFVDGARYSKTELTQRETGQLRTYCDFCKQNSSWKGKCDVPRYFPQFRSAFTEPLNTA